MSWIAQEEKLLRVQENFKRELMESIKCVFLFTNQNNYIEQITDEIVDVYDGKISKERIIKLIQEKRHNKPNVTYTFIDSFIFLVDLEPEHIQAYSQMEVSSRFISKLPLLEDINIPPSIFIFHDLNTIYFLFQETERVPAKPALRNKISGNKITKRVTYSTQLNKTRKNISNI
jgi:hypothetical protein